MYRRNKKKGTKSNSPDQITTIVAEGSSIEGSIMTSSARIDGTFKGEAKLYGTLVIGEKGHVDGDIHAPNILIFGKAEGKIRANALEIKNTGIVEGEISVQSLSVESGGIFNGNSIMKKGDSNKVSEEPDSAEVASFQEFKSQK